MSDEPSPNNTKPRGVQMLRPVDQIGNQRRVRIQTHPWNRQKGSKDAPAGPGRLPDVSMS